MPFRTFSTKLVFGFHIATQPSLDEEANKLLSELNETQLTSDV
jgi:hypothetical protein